MKGKCILAVGLVSVLGLGFYPHALLAQGTAKTFSLVYSNNLNGEIEPCPT